MKGSNSSRTVSIMRPDLLPSHSRDSRAASRVRAATSVATRT